MSFMDFRGCLSALVAKGHVHEIRVPVNKDWEIGAICPENSRENGPALIFSKVDDYRTPLVVGVLGSPQRFSLATGFPSSIAEITEKWFSSMAHPLPPKIIANAPCKEVKLEKVDLYQDPFPVPKWHPLDAGPELGTLHAVMSKGRKTSFVNCGMYRNEILGKDILGLNLSNPQRHIARQLEEWKEVKAPMPVAIAVGLDPILTLLSAAPIPWDLSEYSIAGALLGGAYEVTPAETADLLVPANAEMIIEGEIPTDSFYPHEGPFGEFAGYMGSPQENSLFIRVKKITHRKDPLFQGTYEGKFMNESKMIRSVIKSVYTMKHLRESGITGVKDVCVTPAGCASFHTVVSIRKSHPRYAEEVIHRTLNQPGMLCKYCVVVDEDVDPWDPFQVEWAIATRVQAGRDLTIVKDGKGTAMDPSQVPSKRGRSDLLGIDATSPIHEYDREGAAIPPLADPPEELVRKVRKRWGEYGLGITK